MAKLLAFLYTHLQLRFAYGHDGILREKRSHILSLAKQYHADDVRVFGSVARGDSIASSDVDFLINPTNDCSLFDLGGLLMELQDLLGCKVDLVPEDSLKPQIRERVMKEAIPL